MGEERTASDEKNIPEGMELHGFQAVELLQALIPALPRDHIVASIPQVAPQLPETADVQTIVEAAAAHLGQRFYRIEASLDELFEEDAAWPAIEWSESPRVLSKDTKGKFRVWQQGRWSKLKSSRAERKESRVLWVPSPRLALLSITHARPTQRMIRYLKTERGLVQLILVYAAFVELLALAAPLAVQILINTIGFGMLIQPVLVVSALLLIALTGAALLRVLQTIAVEVMARRFVERTISELAERLCRLSPEYQAAYPAHRFFEIASVDKAFFVLGLDLVALCLQLVTATILLAVYHPLLLGFALALAIAAWLAIQLPFKRALSWSLEESSAKYAIAAWLSRHPRDEPLTQAKLTAGWLKARSSGFRVLVAQQVSLYTVQVIFSTLLLVLGGRLVILGQLTLGQLVAAELVTTTALASLGKIGKQLPKVYDLITSFEKLGKLVDLPLVSDEPEGDGQMGSLFMPGSPDHGPESFKRRPS